jgi:hypothetical protein
MSLDGALGGETSACMLDTTELARNLYSHGWAQKLDRAVYDRGSRSTIWIDAKLSRCNYIQGMIVTG